MEGDTFEAFRRNVADAAADLLEGDEPETDHCARRPRSRRREDFGKPVVID